jgi:hypothetical protein
MRKNIFVGLLFIVGLSGCHSTNRYNRKMTSRVVKNEHVTTIYQDKTATNYVRIDKVINSSCFCADAIAERYVDHRLVYRLYYGCSIYKTRKELFSYCSRGALMERRLFDGTDEKGTDYETRLDPTDKLFLLKIDSFIQTEN